MPDFTCEGDGDEGGGSVVCGSPDPWDPGFLCTFIKGARLVLDRALWCGEEGTLRLHAGEDAACVVAEASYAIEEQDILHGYEVDCFGPDTDVSCKFELGFFTEFLSFDEEFPVESGLTTYGFSCFGL